MGHGMTYAHCLGFCECWTASENVSRIAFSPYRRFNQQTDFPRNLLVNISQSVPLLGQERNKAVNRVCWQFLLLEDSFE